MATEHRLTGLVEEHALQLRNAASSPRLSCAATRIRRGCFFGRHSLVWLTACLKAQSVAPRPRLSRKSFPLDATYRAIVPHSPLFGPNCAYACIASYASDANRNGQIVVPVCTVYDTAHESTSCTLEAAGGPLYASRAKPVDAFDREGLAVGVERRGRHGRQTRGGRWWRRAARRSRRPCPTSSMEASALQRALAGAHQTSYRDRKRAPSRRRRDLAISNSSRTVPRRDAQSWPPGDPGVGSTRARPSVRRPNAPGSCGPRSAHFCAHRPSHRARHRT